MTVRNWLAARSGTLAVWLAALICCCVAALAWFGYGAAAEWHRSSTELVERRTHELADLLGTALDRDMRAVQVSVLDGRDWNADALAAPHLLNDTVEVAFARYPYPEVFFTWRGGVSAPMFFARSDRRPTWLPRSGVGDRYPVEIVPSPQIAQPLFTRIQRDIDGRSEYSVFDIGIDGKTYQAVSRILYDDLTRDRPQGVFGFVVDLAWVRHSYFSDITDQVTRIAGAGAGVTCQILDESGRPIVGAVSGESTLSAARAFPVLFFDPIIVAAGRPADLVSRTWSVNVDAAHDPTVAISLRGERRTLLVVSAGALAIGLGLVVTVRAGRATADMATMRADFVSTVTHGLKTPVSVIRGIGETLVRRRVTTPDGLHEYAQLLDQEAHRLTRLINNMLAYARVTDAADIYLFEPQSPAETVHEVLRGFQRLLLDANFATEVCLEPELPDVWADRTALVLALDNLVDNALRYARESALLIVNVRAVGPSVEFAVTDRGHGIAPDELARVQRRFARGRSTTGHGSGLGLSIVSRIAVAHRGQFRIESVVGVGTTARLVIPSVSNPCRNGF